MVTLSATKRNAIRNLCANNLVYSIIQHSAIAGCLKQCEYIKVFQEQLFLEAIDIIDSIRELNYEESRQYAVELYNKLLNQYTVYANSLTKNYVDIKHKTLSNEIELLTGLVVFVVASSVILSHSQFATELYQNLIQPMNSTQNQSFVKVFKQPLCDLSNVQKSKWQEYYSSEEYLSEDILNKLETIQSCIYLQPENIIQTGARTVDEYENQLRLMCEDSASALASFLKRGRDLGYLYFFKNNAKQVYNNLRKSFPQMRSYTYQNFVAECRKVGLEFS